MTKLTDAGNNGSDPTVFATNLSEIIVEAATPRASRVSPIWPIRT